MARTRVPALIADAMAADARQAAARATETARDLAHEVAR